VLRFSATAEIHPLPSHPDLQQSAQNECSELRRLRSKPQPWSGRMCTRMGKSIIRLSKPQQHHASKTQCQLSHHSKSLLFCRQLESAASATATSAKHCRSVGRSSLTTMLGCISLLPVFHVVQAQGLFSTSPSLKHGSLAPSSLDTHDRSEQLARSC
jgi:hypothetical protein